MLLLFPIRFVFLLSPSLPSFLSDFLFLSSYYVLHVIPAYIAFIVFFPLLLFICIRLFRLLSNLIISITSFSISIALFPSSKSLHTNFYSYLLLSIFLISSYPLFFFIIPLSRVFKLCSISFLYSHPLRLFIFFITYSSPTYLSPYSPP